MIARGDDIWVENHYGEFEKRTVVKVTKYQVITRNQRFSITTGWEYAYKDKALKTGARHRSRIHNGDGVLYTQDYINKLTRRKQMIAQQTELIYTILSLSPDRWRRFDNDKLTQLLKELQA